MGFNARRLVSTLRKTASPLSCRASNLTSTSLRSLASGVSAGPKTMPTSPAPTASVAPPLASMVCISTVEYTTVPATNPEGISASRATGMSLGMLTIGSSSSAARLISQPRCPPNGATLTTTLSAPLPHLRSNTKAGVPPCTVRRLRKRIVCAICIHWPSRSLGGSSANNSVEMEATITCSWSFDANWTRTSRPAFSSSFCGSCTSSSSPHRAKTLPSAATRFSAA
mmetsp:Transcript_25026/g.58106  ORF Transcript_25026/g.58106 Transcript_25026/m.58106 type:complete len:226 (-) Transcript_25026:102-779(-)